jgi:hypothetical protein
MHIHLVFFRLFENFETSKNIADNTFLIRLQPRYSIVTRTSILNNFCEFVLEKFENPSVNQLNV